MKDIFKDAFKTALENGDMASIFILLKGLDVGVTSITTNDYLYAIFLSKRNDLEKDIKRAMAGALLTPTEKGDIPLKKMIEPMGNYRDANLLTDLDTELAAYYNGVLNLLENFNEDDLGTLDFILSHAGKKLQKSIFGKTWIRTINKTIRAHIINYSVGTKDNPDYLKELVNSICTFDELLEWDMLTEEAVFALIFFDYVLNDWDRYKIPEDLEHLSAREKMCLLKYYEFNFGWDEEIDEWVSDIAENDKNVFVKIIAIQVYMDRGFDCYVFGKIFRFLSKIDVNCYAAKKYQLFSDDGSDSFFSECLYGMSSFRKPAYITLKKKKRSKQYLNIMTEFFDGYDEGKTLYECLDKAFDDALAQTNDKQFLQALVNDYSMLCNFDIKLGQRFYLKCLGGSVAVVEVSDDCLSDFSKYYFNNPSKDHKFKAPFIGYGIEDKFFVNPKFSNYENEPNSAFCFKVVEFIGSTYGSSKHYFKLDDLILELKVGDIFKIEYKENYSGNTKDLLHFYYTYDLAQTLF